MITEQTTDNGLTLIINGKIDKITAPEVQTKVLAAVQKNPNLTLDFAGVEYISSAGLRALLLGQKSASAKGGSMIIINVSNEVMNVFKLSGFDKILTIR